MPSRSGSPTACVARLANRLPDPGGLGAMLR
jgi:hypothetical protein